MAAAAILDFENVEILGARRLGMAKMHHHAKFRGDRPNRCRDMAIFLFLKMPAAAILHFQNVEILGVGKLKKAKRRHHAKLRGDRSNRWWVQLSFSSVWQVGWVTSVLSL